MIFYIIIMYCSEKFHSKEDLRDSRRLLHRTRPHQPKPRGSNVLRKVNARETRRWQRGRVSRFSLGHACDWFSSRRFSVPGIANIYRITFLYKPWTWFSLLFVFISIKMCTEIKFSDFITVHHELGHVQYYMNYVNQPALCSVRRGSKPRSVDRK